MSPSQVPVTGQRIAQFGLRDRQARPDIGGLHLRGARRHHSSTAPTRPRTRIVMAGCSASRKEGHNSLAGKTGGPSPPVEPGGFEPPAVSRRPPDGPSDRAIEHLTMLVAGNFLSGWPVPVRLCGEASGGRT